MELIDLAIKAHMDNECFATFSKIDKFNGGILEIPENIISKKESQKCIYEIDDDKVNIYINGIKERSVTCPIYACRPLISADMVFRLSYMGLTPSLLKVTNSVNEEIVLDEILPTKSAANLLDVPEKRNKKLEDKLYTCVELFYQTGKKEIHDSVLDGFEVIQKHYNGEMDATA